MNETSVLCCHAPALSYLLFEGLSNKRDQVGLLLGSVKSHVLTRITDDPAVFEETKTIVYIESTMKLPDGLVGPFGEISEESLVKWIVPCKDKVIGCYSARRQNITRKASLKEILFHPRLMQSLGINYREMFILGLVSTITHQPKSTHSFHYAFHTFNQKTKKFVEFPLKICNLSDRSNDAAGCLESRLYPEARHFRVPTLETSNTGNITDSLNKYLKDCTAILREGWDKLYKLEDERAGLEKKIDEYRGYLNTKHELSPLIVASKKPKNVDGDSHYVRHYLVHYDPAQDYAGADADKFLFANENDDEEREAVEEMDRDVVQGKASDSPGGWLGDNAMVTDPAEEAEAGPEPKIQKTVVDSVGDVEEVVEELDSQLNKTRVSPSEMKQTSVRVISTPSRQSPSDERLKRGSSDT